MQNSLPKRREPLFWIVLALLLFFWFLGLNTDLQEYSQHELIHIPTGYFYLIFFLDLLTFSSLLLIFFWRKIGIYLFPLGIILHMTAHLYYLDTFLYTDVTALFIYIGIGLLSFIPNWEKYV